MASIVGDVPQPSLQPGSSYNPGTAIGTAAIPYEAITTVNSNINNLTLAPTTLLIPRIDCEDLIIARPLSASGTASLTTTPTLVYTPPCVGGSTTGGAQQAGSGFIYVYTSDYSITSLVFFCYGAGTLQTTNPGSGRMGFGPQTGSGTAVTFSTGTGPTFNDHEIRAALASGTASVNYRVFHMTNKYP